MAGLIWVTKEDSWRITGSGYVPLLHRASAASDNQADRELLFQAELFQLLDFCEMDPTQRTRLGRTVALAAENLRTEVLAGDEPDAQAYAARLAELAAMLHTHFG